MRSIPQTDKTPASLDLKTLEAAACQDLTIARLTLGLLDSICGVGPSVIFPGYHWGLADVRRLPRKLARHAQNLVAAAKPGMILNAFLLSRLKIARAVYAMRRRSPYGRRRVKIADRWRKKYPQLEPSPASTGERLWLRSVAVLAEEVGQPLGPWTIRLARAFKPSRIEILKDREPEYCASCLGQMRIRLTEDGFTVAGVDYVVNVEPTKRTRTIRGVLEDFFETGTEGVIWSVVDDDERGYDALYPIDAGDHLTIQDQLGRKLWSGKIQCDRKSGFRRYPLNPKLGQPCALGHWVHWTQEGFKPDDWARYFIRPDFDRLRGILRKKRGTRRP